MAAGVLKNCSAYSFVQNFATTEFPDAGCSKRDVVISKAVRLPAAALRLVAPAFAAALLTMCCSLFRRTSS